MAYYDESTINFDVYEDGKNQCGIAQITMPNLSALTGTLSGSGIAGNVEYVIPGHYDAMSATFNFRTMTEYSNSLSKPERHNIDLRAPVQVEDPVSGTLITRAIKHIMVVIPKTDNGGTVQPANPTENSMEFAVRYWATYIDNVKVREIDPFNMICYIDGTDYLASLKSALGRT